MRPTDLNGVVEKVLALVQSRVVYLAELPELTHFFYDDHLDYDLNDFKRVGSGDLSKALQGLWTAVQEAVSKEAQYCSFDYLGYMKVYPEIKIDKFTTQDGSIIYTMTHRDSEEFFRFAIRGCVFPPGI